MQMAAIRAMHPIEQAAELSLRAGCDLLLVAHTPSFAMRAVLHLARTAENDAELRARLEQSAARVNRMRALLEPVIPANPYPVDSTAIVREVARRLAGVSTGTRRSAPRDPTLQR